MSARAESELTKRRNFTSLLILANFFRFLAYVIVGLAGILTIVAVAVALVSHNSDTLLQLIAGFAGAIPYGLGLFLASELIRLLVGIAKDVSRMAGRDGSAASTDAPVRGPIKPTT